jgi:Na+/H+-dicarboxylate symporter
LGWLVAPVGYVVVFLFFCCLHFVVFSSVLCSSWESVWLWDTLRSSWFEVSTAVHCTTSRAKRMANHETKHTNHTTHIAKHFAKNDFEWFQFH